MRLPAIVDPRPGSIVEEVLSPAFDTDPPNVGNHHLIPAAVAAMMAPSWDTRRFPAQPIRLHHLRDVYVVGEGLVFDRDLNVLGLSLTQHTHAETGPVLVRLEQAISAGTVIEDPGTTLLCQKRGMNNFGHWLIELLPIAHLALPPLQAGTWFVLAPALPGRIGAVIRYSLSALGVPSAAIRAGDGTPRHAEELILVHGLTSHGYSISPLILPAIDALMAGVPPDPPAPLWISRAGDIRHLWNEHEVEDVLATLGWRILYPGTMPLHAQIAAFRGATAIAGVHGAGLTGMVFAPPGTPVTSFAPAAMPDTFFWLLSCLRSQRYTEIRAPHDLGTHGETAWDAALVLSLPEVLAALGRPLSL